MPEVVQIPLTLGYFTVIDTDDSGLVSRHKWHAHPVELTVYARTWIRPGVGMYLHRLLMNARNGQFVDHRDHDGLHNRRLNLRLATRSQNHGNTIRPINNTSGYKGVSLYRPTDKWRAYINHNGRRRHLGYFTDPWEAAQAYNAAALAQWGEFALLNERGHAR